MSEAILEARGACKAFAVRRLVGWRLQTSRIEAVSKVDLALAAGESVALIGESGCGKSTLARCLVGLLPLDSGRILLRGEALSSLEPEARKRARLEVQMVFQDAAQALDPRMTAGGSIDEALEAAGVEGTERAERRDDLLGEMGLSRDYAKRYPHQLSGGQKQRISLARALACRPRVLVLDEPVASLDASLRAQVLESLEARRREDGTSLLLISHDLTAASFADRVAVMLRGRLVEAGPSDRVLSAPEHPYTAELLAARPTLELGWAKASAGRRTCSIS